MDGHKSSKQEEVQLYGIVSLIYSCKTFNCESNIVRNKMHREDIPPFVPLFLSCGDSGGMEVEVCTRGASVWMEAGRSFTSHFILFCGNDDAFPSLLLGDRILNYYYCNSQKSFRIYFGKKYLFIFSSRWLLLV